MTKRDFRIEMMYRQHDVTDLKRHGKGDLDYILYMCRCVKCGEDIYFRPQNIGHEIDGPQICKGKEGKNQI